MRRVALASMLSIALLFGLPQAGAFAQPTPSPTPTTSQTAAHNSLKKPTKKPGLKTRTVPASALKVPSRAPAAIRALVSDVTGGRISKAQAADRALQMVTDPESLPASQRLTKSTTEADLMVLGALATSSSTASRSAPKGAPNGVPDCDVNLIGQHDCKYYGNHTIITYTQEVLSSDEARDENADGIPDYVKAWSTQAEQSWTYYSGTLGMTAPSSPVTIELHSIAQLVSDIFKGTTICGSWPDATIKCAGRWSADDIDWIAPHEMFHQFQWPYITSDLKGTWPTITASVYNIDPWMETTANWAASHYAHDVLANNKTTSGAEVSYIDRFYADTESGLVASRLDSATISGLRAYGTAPIAEFLTQQTSTDFVRRSFSLLSPVAIDGYSQIADAMASYSYDLAYWLVPMWHAIYTMCDPQPDDPWWSLQGGIVDSWCSRSYVKDAVRPDHFTGSIRSSQQTTDFNLVPGGAAFMNLDLDPEAGGAGSILSLEFDDTVDVATQVEAWAWNDKPGGETCGTDQAITQGSASVVLEVRVPVGCDNASVVIVGGGDNLRGYSSTFPVAWSGRSTGAVISNGAVTLGVNDDGSLGLGGPAPTPCRHAGTADLTSVPPAGIGLVDESSSFDAVRDNWHQPCHPADFGEGWSIHDPDTDSSWGTSALGYQVTGTGTVISFTHDASTATSVVELPDGYKVIQTWAPVFWNDRIYKLTVAIAPNGDPADTTLKYRRVLPLEVDGDGLHGEVAGYAAAFSQGASDHITDMTSNMIWVNGEYESIDEPTTPLPHYVWSDLMTNGWWVCDTLGFAADINVHAYHNSSGDPQFSIYYGFADSVADANSALGAVGVGATSRSVISVPTTDSGSHVVLVGYKDGD